MANPWGEMTSLVFFYIFLALICIFILSRIYKCIKSRNSDSCAQPLMTKKSLDEEARSSFSRNSSVDNIFNEFQKSVNKKPDSANTSVENNFEKPENEEKKGIPNRLSSRNKIISYSLLEEGLKKTNHINALLNLLAVKEMDDDGLKEDEMDILKRRVKIFTHEDLKAEVLLNNTTSHIENLSKSFCLNIDEKIRNKPSCMYCLENLNIGDKVIYLRVCKHLFHEACCLDWFAKKSFCPICKKHPLLSLDVTKILDPDAKY